jgi:thiamine biosynthesis lipoprotein
MATDVTITALGTDADLLGGTVDDALAVFADVEQQCTRFDARSPLMVANGACNSWVAVPARCYAAVEAAAAAYRRTGGRFDPRVHDDLHRLGYSESLAFEEGAHVEGDVTATARKALPLWEPRFDQVAGALHLGGYRVDLGGIGKGLAVRWAAETLRGSVANFIINAGGDCYAAGHPADSEKWLIGVEDPLGSPDPIAVVAVSDRAVATTSIRIRRWTAGGVEVHHLIDAKTGLPGGDGLRAVTVVGADAADAEVDAKTLFLEGSGGVAMAARTRDSAACWVADDGGLGLSRAFTPYLYWQKP